MIVERFRNLVAVPSYHYEPAFAQAVIGAWSDERPSVVALELPAGVEAEADWALTCWPTPVCSMSGDACFLWFAGDSMLEAFRLARRDGVGVACIDAWVAGETFPPGTIPGPECVDRAGSLLTDVVSAMVPPTPSYAYREACMAAALDRLMREHERVMWVGGMAHWRRIRERLEKSDFSARAVATVRPLFGFERARPTAAGVATVTGRIPRLHLDYARDPLAYDEARAIGGLLTRAAERLDATTAAAPQSAERLLFSQLDDDLSETVTTADLTRVAIFARNLAMSSGVGDRPSFTQLVGAAHDVVGPRYAAHVYKIGLAVRASAAARNLPRMRILPRLWAAAAPFATRSFRLSRRKPVDLHKDLPRTKPGSKDVRAGCTLESDDARYEQYAYRVMMYANQAVAEGDGASAPFNCGLRGGIDLRATLGDPFLEEVHVIEPSRGRLAIRNAVIDYTSASEDSALLRGQAADMGWTDPRFLERVGSVSLNIRNPLRARDPEVRQMYREWSFVSLDLPTGLPNTDDPFYARVIIKLVSLFDEFESQTLRESRYPDVYSWLDVILPVFAGKRIAWFSRYIPSARFHQLARTHRVEIVHVPLSRIPQHLRDQNDSFRDWWVTREQWDVISARDEAAQRKASRRT